MNAERRHDPRVFRPVRAGLLLALAFALAGRALLAAAPTTDAETRFNMALTHLREGRTDMAIDELRKAVKDDPKNAYFHKGLGVAFMQKREFGRAAESFRKALELNPYYADVRNDLGTALVLDGKRDEGKREFVTVFNDPTYNAPEVAARNLAQAYFEEKRYDDALTWYRTALQRNAKYPDAYLGLADVLVAQSKFDDAATQLGSALKQVPDSLALELAFGEACQHAGRFSEGRAALEGVARRDPAGASGRRAVELLRGFPR